MELNEYLSRMKLFYHSFLHATENANDTSDSVQDFITIIKDNHFGEDPDELRLILHTIYKIVSQHRRNLTFFCRVQKIIQYYESKIKQTFSNMEILKIFKKDKLLLLLLIKQKIITVDEEIADSILEIYDQYNSNFFYPEVKPFLEKIQKRDNYEIVLNDPSIKSEKFEENRQIGENDSPICKLIRDDSLDEFISVYTDQELSPLDTIPKSIFETNIYLTKKKSSLIEYAAFFGSLNVFKFLLEKNKNRVVPSLIWNFAIRSGNLQFLLFLQENKIEPAKSSYSRCFLDSVKCHHNDISKFIFDFFFGKDEKDFKEEIFGYYNFELFPDDFKESEYQSIFEYACHYDYVKIVKFLSNENKIDINEVKIRICFLQMKFQLRFKNRVLNFFN